MADTSSLHGLGFQGGGPCHGKRCRSWSSDASLFVWRCRRERTGGSCAGGSAFIPRPATSGLSGGRLASASLPIARAGRMRARGAAARRWKRACSPCATPIRPGARARSPAAWSATGIEAAGALDRARDPAPARPHRRRRPAALGAYQRFEKAAPNLLWQMDFKGWVALADGDALPSADDHRRSLALRAVPGGLRRPAGRARCRPSGDDVPPLRPARSRCSSTTARPGAMPRARWTQAWRVALEARRRGAAQPALSSAEPRQERALPPHARRPRCSRFDASAISPRCSAPSTDWREVYNFERPHEALGQDVPASRYRPSPRPMPERLPQCRIRRARDRAHRLHHQGLCQLQGPALERAERLPRRTCRHPPARPRWPLRHLLRRPPDRDHRLDQSTKVSAMSPNRCRPCPRAEHQARG